VRLTKDLQNKQKFPLGSGWRSQKEEEEEEGAESKSI